MKGTQGSGTSLVEDYPIKQHPFNKNVENTPLLYNVFFSQPRKIIKIDVTTNKTIKIYKSITDAANDIKKSRSEIHKYLKKIKKTIDGFKWEYLK